MTHHAPSRIVLPWVLALLPALPVLADQLHLAGDQKLTGTVTAIRPDGAVLVQTTVAAEPLVFKPDAVRRVVFAEVPGQTASAPAMLHLRNGDSLAGTVEKVTEQTVVFSAGDAGRLEIPRGVVAGVEQGTDAAQLLYPGPDGPGSWQVDSEDGEGWEHHGGAISIRGKGVTGRRIAALPERFVIAFKLAWTGQPHLRFSFAGDKLLEDGAQNRYYFEFTSTGGINLTREATAGNDHYITLVRVKRLPDTYEDRELLVEIRVDRGRREIQLLLDGESEGRFPDPAPAPPPGAWMVFKSSATRECTTVISNLTVKSWDGRSARRALLQPVAGDSDALTGVDGERFTGVLRGAERAGGALVYRFTCANTDQVMEVPEAAVAALTLARPAVPPPAEAAAPLRIRSASGGLLSVRSAEFAGDTVSVVHPLLGMLKFKRAAIKAIERSAAERTTVEP